MTESKNPEITTLMEGGVIAYPTEGVWGLGCDPYNQNAVERILQMKGRAADKGLILVAANLSQLSSLFQALPEWAKKRLEEHCPGPDTWLIPDSNQCIPTWIKGKFATVAVRVSEHRVVKTLCDEFPGLIVSTSANPEGLPPALSEQEVREYFPPGPSSMLDCIVSGDLGSLDKPSRIKDLMTGQTLRE